MDKQGKKFHPVGICQEIKTLVLFLIKSCTSCTFLIELCTFFDKKLGHKDPIYARNFFMQFVVEVLSKFLAYNDLKNPATTNAGIQQSFRKT